MKKTHETLTIENAHTASTIINKEHPEWGVRRFNHNDSPLVEGRIASSFGSGCDSSLLFDEDFKNWNIVSYK